MEFIYKVKTQEGQILDGKVEAPNEIIAVDTLHENGYIVLSLNPVPKGLFAIDLTQLFGKPNNKDIVIFTRQLATLIDADMPLAEGLRTLAKQVEKPAFKKVISEVGDSVEGGSSLSGALASHAGLFSTFYVKLVKSGELSGKLHDSLNYLADYLERSQGINSKIKGALAYPAFVLFAMVVVGVIMAVYVLPQLLTVFEESGVTDLPLTTRILIWVTSFFNNNLLLILAVMIGAPLAFWRYVNTQSGKIWLDDFKLKAPVFGLVLRNLYLARIAESLATLIKSDIAILDAIKITAELVGNHNYQTVLLDAEENVRGGGVISESFSKYKEIPPLMTSMVAIGERTGKLEYMLGHVSKFYRTESENTVSNISQLIEPILVLVLGAGVAILVSSVLLPIYNVVTAG